MAGTVEHPDIRYVVDPVHGDGKLAGAEPRLRHYPGCGHFDWGHGALLGTPVLATEEQMRTRLPAARQDPGIGCSTHITMVDCGRGQLLVSP